MLFSLSGTLFPFPCAKLPLTHQGSTQVSSNKPSCSSCLDLISSCYSSSWPLIISSYNISQFIIVCVCLSSSVVSDSLQPTKLLCP